MSDFAVEVVVLGPVRKHPDADRLDIAKVYDYDAVVGAGAFKEGDYAAYLPEGAIVPANLLAELGNIQLAGGAKNRVKATRIRGVLSQGIVVSLAAVEKLTGLSGFVVGQDLAEALGVTKWDPENDTSSGGPNRLRTRPGYVDYTPSKLLSWDVENIKKIRHDFVPGEIVSVTEKIHGTYVQIVVERDGNVFISSKGLAKRGESITLNEASLKGNLHVTHGMEVAGHILSNHLGFVRLYNRVTILGEIYGKGVQDMEYGLNTTKFACFSIALDGVILDVSSFLVNASGLGLPTVPLIASVPFDAEGLAEMATRPSYVGNKGLCEGVVIRAMTDGRIAKVINPAYLLRKNATEFN